MQEQNINGKFLPLKQNIAKYYFKLINYDKVI
jgi:hypothetical protein